MKNKGLLIVYTGCSGVGKGTIMSKMLAENPNLRLSVSATTRAPRAGEQDGREYYFVSHERFDEMIAEDGFLEYAEYVGNKYGTPKEPVFRMLDEGLDVILEIEVKGFYQVKKACPDSVTIFIAPPSHEELGRRLRGRGTESDEVIAARLAIAHEELEHLDQFDHVVINDDIDRATQEVLSIISDHKSRQ